MSTESIITLIVTLAINLVTIGGGILGFINLYKKLPKEVENLKIKNAKEKSEALDMIAGDAEEQFLKSAEYRKKFQEALATIEELKLQIAGLPDMQRKIAFLECEITNYQNENKVLREHSDFVTQLLGKYEEPPKIPYIRKVDCSELVKGG